MPIRPQYKWLYPIDWPERCKAIRFGRAKGQCEHCARPHGKEVRHLGDGRWWDEQQQLWRNGHGRPLPIRFVVHFIRDPDPRGTAGCVCVLARGPDADRRRNSLNYRKPAGSLATAVSHAEHNEHPKPFMWTAKPIEILDKVKRGKQSLLLKRRVRFVGKPWMRISRIVGGHPKEIEYPA